MILGRKGKILWFSTLGVDAGDLLMPWVLAIENNLSLTKIAGAIIPYSIQSEINKLIAGNCYKPVIFSSKIKKLVGLLAFLW